MSSLAHRLAMGIPPAYDERTPHVPLPAAAGVVYAHPADLALVTELGARYLTGRRVIASDHVPAGWVHTADDDLRAELDRLLLGHYAALGLAR